MPPPPPISDTTTTAEHRWFIEHVQPHEPALRAYLRDRFPMLRDVDDMVQESYARLFRERSLERIEHTKAYLFAVARNVALDLLRRRQVVSMESMGVIEHLQIEEESPNAAEKASSAQELELLREAINLLPDRCREILQMRKIEGLSHRQIAARLGISENTVNNQLTIGLLRCRDHFRMRGAMKGLA